MRPVAKGGRVDKGFQINIGTKADLGALQQTTSAINQATQAQRNLNLAARGYVPTLAPKATAPTLPAALPTPAAPAAPAAPAKPAPASPIRSQLLGNLDGLGANLLGSLGAPLSVAGAITGLVASVRGLIEHAGAVRDMSEQLGLLPSEFKDIARVAGEAGLPVNDFIQTLSQLRLARRAAAEGDRELRDTFTRFGVSLADLNDPGLRAIDLLRKIGKEAKGLSEADLTKLRDVLGRRSDRVATSLSGLGAQVNEEIDQAIAGVDRFGKFWEKVGGRIRDGLLLTFAQLNENVAGLITTFTMTNVTPEQSGQTQEEKDFKAWKLDKAAIERGQIEPEQASAGYMRREQFNAAFADSQQRGIRLRYDTFLATQQRQADQVNGPNPLFEDLALVKAQKELEEQRRKLAWDMMTADERRVELARQRADIEARIQGDPDALRNIEAQKELLAVQAKEFELNQPKATAAAPSLNAWEQLGAGTQRDARADDVRRIGEQTAQNTADIARSMQQQVELTLRLARLMSPN